MWGCKRVSKKGRGWMVVVGSLLMAAVAFVVLWVCKRWSREEGLEEAAAA